MFDREGKSLPPAEQDPGDGRVLIQLDQPEKWACHATHGDPYFFRKEVSDQRTDP